MNRDVGIMESRGRLSRRKVTREKRHAGKEKRKDGRKVGAR